MSFHVDEQGTNMGLIFMGGSFLEKVLGVLWRNIYFCDEGYLPTHQYFPRS